MHGQEVRLHCCLFEFEGIGDRVCLLQYEVVITPLCVVQIRCNGYGAWSAFILFVEYMDRHRVGSGRTGRTFVLLAACLNSKVLAVGVS